MLFQIKLKEILFYYNIVHFKEYYIVYTQGSSIFLISIIMVIYIPHP